MILSFPLSPPSFSLFPFLFSPFFLSIDLPEKLQAIIKFKSNVCIHPLIAISMLLFYWFFDFEKQ
jgi:hypothetical protein